MARRGSKLPPMVPRWLSIFRSLKFVANPIPILNQNFENYGSTYRFHIGGVKEGMVTRDAEVIRHVLQKNHRNYRKSNIQSNILAQFVGQGLLTADGDFWLRQRRLIQPGFRRDRINNLTALMQVEISRYFDELSHRIQSNLLIDMHREMHRLAFRIVAKTLFSTSIQEQDLELLADRITQLQAFIIKLVRQPYAKWWFRLGGAYHKYHRMAQQIRDTIDQVIQRRRKSDLPNDDLLQMLLDARYEDDGSAMSDSQILDECLIIFVAGHETSANALAWSLQLVGTHPLVSDKLFAEVRAIDRLAELDFEEMGRLDYTRQVIQETLRLYPPGWVLDRVAQEDDRIGSWIIPSGSTLFLYVYGTHHFDAYWQNPETFEPDRFDGNDKVRPDFSYLPFGGGPRLCIGNHFAMLEMQLVLSRFIRQFEFRPTNELVAIEPLITLRPKNGILGRLSVR